MDRSNPKPEDQPTIPADLERLAILLDSEFELPFGIRVGWDGIIDFIPVVGTILTTGMSAYIVVRAVQLGASFSVLARMVLNILIDNALAAIPFVGWIGDFLWKSNLKNVDLLRRHAVDPEKTARRSFGMLVLLFGTLALFTLSLAVLAGWVAWWAFRDFFG